MKKVKSILVYSVILIALLLQGCNQDKTVNDKPEPTYKSIDDILDDISLKFGTDGNFKIVIFSDLQESADVSPEVIGYMNKILDDEKPGLVILGGNTHDDAVTDLKPFLDVIVEPMESRKIPWCHVYGTDSDRNNDVYKSYEYCVSKNNDYVLPILRNDSDKIGYNIWLMDTHTYLNNYVDGLEEQVLLKRTLAGDSNYDTLRFSQVKWYWDTSVALEKHNGKAIPGIMYLHMPLYEFNYIYRNAELSKMQGTKAEKVSAPEVNSGILWTCYEKGDIKAILCGHDRLNDFSGTYMDMFLGYTSTIGRNSDDGTRGARVVQLNQDEEDGFSTRMVYVKELN